VYSAASVYGIGLGPQVPGSDLDASSGGPNDIGVGAAALLNPRNPLFWFGAFLAATAGLIGGAGSVRLGRAKISGSVGKG
jgi:hypothetical protein